MFGWDAESLMPLRLDRLATLYLASPFMRCLPNGQLRIPILMYHSISEEDESRKHGYYRVSTSPSVFASHMAYLHRHGYQTLGPRNLTEFLESGAEAAGKLVLITFDDGYADFYRNAFPVLREFGLTATVFLPTAHVGNTTITFKGRDCLTWSEVRELQMHGISFGSHTVTHPQLRNLANDAIERELTDSKQTIEENTGYTVDAFAYPYAFPQHDDDFKARMRGMLLQAGYQSGFCTTVGRLGGASDPLFLERLPVNGSDDAAFFDAKLRGAYDWVGKLQSVTKMLKTRRVGDSAMEHERQNEGIGTGSPG